MRLGDLRDKYEGLCPASWQSTVTDLSRLPEVTTTAIPDGGWQSHALSIQDGRFVRDQKLREEVFVSCWHGGEEESAAMWSLYSGRSGIAIKTTSDRLFASLLGCDREIELAPIQYMAMSQGLLSGRPWTVKRPSFRHEREIRAATRDPDGKNTGLPIPVTVDILIDEIHVSPDSDPWIEGVVRDAVAKYGFKKRVTRSKLYDLA